jgi:hypoxanthine-DNA glycosylase
VDPAPLPPSPLPIREGLPPVIGADPRVLILGSFPSEKSLDTGQYYANARNQFWRLSGSILGFDTELPYPQRTSAVTGHGLALWDVVHSCRRAGSLDSKIDRKSLVINDFDVFLSSYPTIERVYVNGLIAFELLGRQYAGLSATRLPSSSGALTMSFDEKLTAWRAIG